MKSLAPPSRRPRQDVSAVLVDVCRQSGSIRPIGSAAEPELVDAARFHRVAPLVHVAHRETAPHVADLFRADRLQAITMHLRACAALQQLGSVLSDVEWVTFKGPIFSEYAHPVPGLRSYNDVDVLVAPIRLREASRLLRAAGWRVADYQDMLRNPDVAGEMHWVSPTGVLIDLHWSMINMASRRRLFAVPTSELLQRRVPVSLGSDVVWTLDPIDSLVHACLHAALSGANKLVYLVDVDRLSRHVTDWGEVALRAKAWRAQIQVALVLGRAKSVLETPVPDDLNSRLEVPRSIRGLLALTDRVAPVPRGRTNAGLSKFVARALRPTARTTAVAAGRNALRWVLGRTQGAPPRVGERLSADQVSLEIYLAAVESAAGRLGPAESRTPGP